MASAMIEKVAGLDYEELAEKTLTGDLGLPVHIGWPNIIVPESDFAFTIMTNAGTSTGSMAAVDWLTKRIVEKQFNWWWKFWIWW